MSRRHLQLAAIVIATLALVGAAWFLFGRRHVTVDAPAGTDAAASIATKAPKGTVAMSDVQMRRLGIVLVEAKAATSAPLASLPAVIVPPANARVAVSATFAGVVTRIFAVEGQSVRKGQPLAIVSSRDVLTVGADLSRASAQLGVARSSAARLGQLAREGVIAGARADEARAKLVEAQVNASEKRRILALSNASGTSGSYTLSAPIAGARNRRNGAGGQSDRRDDGTVRDRRCQSFRGRGAAARTSRRHR